MVIGEGRSPCRRSRRVPTPSPPTSWPRSAPAPASWSPRALAIPSDLDGRRTWERQRESTLAVLEAELEELRANVQWSSEEIARLNAQLKS